MNTTLNNPVVSREEWLEARRALLQKEKELTRLKDKLSAERRQLPWIKIEKEYVFDTPQGKKTLSELFQNKSQLIVYHFMFGPGWQEGCVGCSFGSDHTDAALQHLLQKDVNYVAVSRAPLSEIEPFRKRMGWKFDWVSSNGSDFNYDFHVTLDPKVAPVEYNYRNQAETEAKTGHAVTLEGEHHGLSVLFRPDDDIFHTYSVFARGCESLPNAYRLLDATPYGRQQEFEDSPSGWPQKPTYG